MRILNGFEWPEEDHGMAACAFTNLPDLDRALAYVKDFSVCIQAGGNVGVWPKELLKHFGYVYTFEPCVSNFSFLCRNLPEITAYKFPCALGNGGVGELIQNKENIGAGQMVKEGFTPILRIDDLHLPSCGFIQLDIEGMELEALEGGKETIYKYKPVLMLEESGHGPSVQTFLDEFGYKVVEHQHRDLICVPL